MRVRPEIFLAVTACASPLAAQRWQRSTPATPPAADRVLVPAGPFTMGADAGGEPDERPAHTRVLAAFAIDRHEVTRRDYFRCVRARVCNDASLRRGWVNPDAPVTGVTWFMAERYCQWAGARLPTEAEWEKAARGSDRRVYPWGNEAPTPARAVYGLRMNVGEPASVGSRPAGASAFGALDMAGNVWEWTATVYDPYAYRSPETEPTCARALATYADLRRRGAYAFTGAMGIPARCERVLRGGAWNYWPDGLRSTNRVHHEPTGAYPVSGFRCAVTP
ncbi:MAG: SUMF1/EgtB/PvdO family nonheme iron enzyme [Myxococcales bacterium]|nr:SUMF1/EgtB/PvdO family nonheme iron enzyme [Myxococcales bacterium]